MDKILERSKSEERTIFNGRINGMAARMMSGTFASEPVGLNIRLDETPQRKLFFIEPIYQKGSTADTSGIVLSARTRVLEDDKASYDVITIRLDRQANPGDNVVMCGFKDGPKVVDVEHNLQGFEPAFDATREFPINSMKLFATGIRMDSKNRPGPDSMVAKFLLGIEYVCMENLSESGTGVPGTILRTGT